MTLEQILAGVVCAAWYRHEVYEEGDVTELEALYLEHLASFAEGMLC